MSFEAEYVQEGAAIDYTPSGAVDAGDVIVQGTLVGVAKLPIAASALGALAIEGVFDFAKEASLVVAVGADIYWDDSAKEADKTNTNVYIGKAIIASASAETTVRVALNQLAVDGSFAGNISCVDLTATGDIDCDNLAVTTNITAVVDVVASGDLGGATGTFTGNVGCVDVVASGDLGGATGTFTGNVGCVDIDATGDVGAATGTFTGNVGCVDLTATGDLAGVNFAITGAVISMANIPTSDPSVVGQLWANSNVLTISV